MKTAENGANILDVGMKVGEVKTEVKEVKEMVEEFDSKFQNRINKRRIPQVSRGLQSLHQQVMCCW